MRGPKRQESFGVIPLRRKKEGWEVFLLRHRSGKHWGFPKGKQEKGETSLQTAQRELFEETGLRLVTLLEKEPLQESYAFYHLKMKIDKTVFYFIALVEGEISLQAEEVLEGRWMPLQEGLQTLTFPESKQLLLTLQGTLQSRE